MEYVYMIMLVAGGAVSASYTENEDEVADRPAEFLAECTKLGKSAALYVLACEREGGEVTPRRALVALYEPCVDFITTKEETDADTLGGIYDKWVNFFTKTN